MIWGPAMAAGAHELDAEGFAAAIGARVRLRRIERGLSQAALADAAGVAIQHVRNCEGGHPRISCVTLARLAAPLQVGAGWLLEGDPVPARGRKPPREMPRAPASEGAAADNAMLQACLVMAEEAFSGLPLAIYLTSSDGVLLYCNQAAALFAGRWPRIGQDRWCVSWRLYDLEGNRMAHEECPMAIALQTGRPVRGAIAVAARPDGSRQSFVPFPTPLIDGRGELFGGFNALYPLKLRAERAVAGQQAD